MLSHIIFTVTAMTERDFCRFLEHLSTLSEKQKSVVFTTIQDGSSRQGLPRLFQRIEQNFSVHPQCGHCHSEHVSRCGYQHQRQRYKCRDCGRTCNALTGSPLSYLKRPAVLDQYLECMTTSMTLRPAARTCGISLDTSFHMRQRIMQLLQGDQADVLEGIVEMDETFFRQSNKGVRNLPRPSRRRGGIKPKPREPGKERKKPGFKVTQVPVLVACDRQKHIRSHVLKNMKAQGMEKCLKGRIPPGTPVCADDSLQHDLVASSLGLVLKSLVTRLGETVRDGVFHLQHVNAHHSQLKSWINWRFKGVSKKHLDRYLGWRRALSNCDLTPQRLIEKLAGRWILTNFLLE